MFRRIVLALLLTFPMLARAGSLDLTPAQLGVVAAPLTGSPSISFRSGGYANLTIYVQYTRSTATAVKIACTSGPTATVQAPLGVASVASNGAITMSPATWTYPVTASGVLRIIVSPINDNHFSCVFTGTGAAVGDTVSVYARLGGTP